MWGNWLRSSPRVPTGLAGLELGGVPIATLLSAHTGLPTFFVRKQAKKYGTEKICEGGDISGMRLLIVEDVVTTGGQIILSAQDLRAEGAVVDHALCVIDREAGGADSGRRRRRSCCTPSSECQISNRPESRARSRAAGVPYSGGPGSNIDVVRI